jgi:hypothetical protein
MGNPRLFLGTAVPLDSAQTMTALEVVVTDNVGPDITLSGTLPSLTAGTYSPHGWMAHGAQKLAQWLFDRLSAHVSITVDPSSVNNIDVSLGIPDANLIAGVGTTLPHLHIGSLAGAATASGPVVIKSLKVDQAWGSLFGLARADETGGSIRVINAVAGVLDADARFQPWWAYCCRASLRDSGDYEEVAAAFADTITGGGVSYYEFGESTFARDWEIVAQDRRITGPAVRVGTFLSFGANRSILNLQSINEARLYGMVGTYKRTDNLATPQYLRIGRTLYPARFRRVTGDTFELLERLPLSLGTPAAGTEISIVSELHALTLHWRRTRRLMFYDPIEASGQTSWMGKAYAPNKQGAWKIGHERAARTPLFTMAFAGKFDSNPGFASP